jgi:hypothetical protein
VREKDTSYDILTMLSKEFLLLAKRKTTETEMTEEELLCFP